MENGGRRDEGGGRAGARPWTGRTRGGYWGNLFFITALRLLGLRAAYVLLLPIPIYYLIADRKSVRASSEYLERVFGPLPALRRLWYVYRHFYSLGRMLLDKVCILGGGRGRFRYIFDGEENLEKALAPGRGVVILSSHVGNWEAAAEILHRAKVPVNIVAFENEVEHIRRMVAGAEKEKAFRVIAVSGGFEHSLEALAALRRGEAVALHGDRVMGGASARASFFGREATFPAGAWWLAAVSGAPLLQVFAMREPDWTYRLIALPPRFLEVPPRAGRAGFAARCVAEYAGHLENVLRRYPFQWYNFYPFWD
ncbi:MAG: hypothetical protein N3A38_11235 [Planctomycetota bacterium]|nr:hypothetical protein [Planctomycetota bacterium]